MEQYIYIFTIILEIIVCVQFCRAINDFDKKVVALNNDISLVCKEIVPVITNLRCAIKKFNKISAIIIKAKKFAALRHLVFVADIVGMVFLFKSFKTYKGLSKLKFIRKLFSYSIIRALLSYIKAAV